MAYNNTNNGSTHNQNSYVYNPDEWTTVNEIRIPNSYSDKSGLVIRVYKKTTDNFMRLGIQEYYTDKSGNVKTAKMTKIDLRNMQDVLNALKESYTVASRSK